jgi:hypothetical protein
MRGVVAMSNAADDRCQGATFTIPVALSGAPVKGCPDGTWQCRHPGAVSSPAVQPERSATATFGRFGTGNASPTC